MLLQSTKKTNLAHPVLQNFSLALFFLNIIVGTFLGYSAYKIDKSVQLIENQISLKNSPVITKINTFSEYSLNFYKLDSLLSNLLIPNNNEQLILLKSNSQAGNTFEKVDNVFQQSQTKPLLESEWLDMKKQFKEISQASLNIPTSVKEHPYFNKLFPIFSQKISDADILFNNKESLDIINTYRKNLLNTDFLNSISQNPQKTWIKYFSPQHGKDVHPSFLILSLQTGK